MKKLLVVVLALILIALGNNLVINGLKNKVNFTEQLKVNDSLKQEVIVKYDKKIKRVRRLNKKDSKLLFDSLYLKDSLSDTVVIRYNQLVEANLNIIKLDSCKELKRFNDEQLEITKRVVKENKKVNRDIWIYRILIALSTILIIKTL